MRALSAPGDSMKLKKLMGRFRANAQPVHDNEEWRVPFPPAVELLELCREPKRQRVARGSTQHPVGEVPSDRSIYELLAVIRCEFPEG